MSTRKELSDVARAELDATLDSLTFRALSETLVVLGVVCYVPCAIVRSIVNRKKATP